MKGIIKDLWLAIGLIILTASILLVSDWGQRQAAASRDPGDYPSIAIMQITSTTLLDAHVAGIISRLDEHGYYAPGGANVRLYNPQGDFGTANAIAREIANGPYDMVITSSTVALQVFASANQSARKIHVFGGVTDPYGAGVGITGKEPHQHPPHMAGIGTFQPVRQTFVLARELNPNLKRVGVVWNPGEQCSEACMNIAWAVCEELGIDLVEAIAMNTSEVSEAVRSLIGRRVEAIWIGGDSVAASSARLIVNLARQAGIPVFTNDHLDVLIGALFGLGANYFTVGEHTADVAADIMDGASPASFRIENVIPERFRLNHEVLASLDNNWKISTHVQALLDDQTEEICQIAVISLADYPLLDKNKEGLRAGLLESGLQSGQDFIIREYSAQGDMGKLPMIIDAVVGEQPDLIISITTPVLLAVAQKVKDIPVVFTVASDPEKLNLFADGRPPNICGIHDDPPVDKLLAMAIDFDNSIEAVGIIYDPAQMNSLIAVEKLREAGSEYGVAILEATVNTSSELTLATESVIMRGAQALILSTDNLVLASFPAVHRAATASGIPVFVTEPDYVEMGAAGAIGEDFYEWGRETGRMAAQVIAGTPPSELPVMATRLYERIDP